MLRTFRHCDRVPPTLARKECAQTPCSTPATYLQKARALSNRGSTLQSADPRSPQSEPVLFPGWRDYPNYSPPPAARSKLERNAHHVPPIAAPISIGVQNPPSPACPCHRHCVSLPIRAPHRKLPARSTASSPPAHTKRAALPISNPQDSFQHARD